jgi:hypothetical protein
LHFPAVLCLNLVEEVCGFGTLQHSGAVHFLSGG